ncbi:hypothetical protein G2W53_040879 [Senna tora]|uniref:Uncharacterized protein n=1 Tax=Senna tora TaxID=362788 RepID=A0A834VXJ5_9FABA|nr:hypothetical protein G2W53_040879 [Senna tora]
MKVSISSAWYFIYFSVCRPGSKYCENLPKNALSVDLFLHHVSPINLFKSGDALIFCSMYLPLFIMKIQLNATSLYSLAFPSRFESNKDINLTNCAENGDCSSPLFLLPRVNGWTAPPGTRVLPASVRIEFSRSPNMVITLSPSLVFANEASVLSSFAHSSRKRLSKLAIASRKVSYMSRILKSFSAARFVMATPSAKLRSCMTIPRERSLKRLIASDGFSSNTDCASFHLIDAHFLESCLVQVLLQCIPPTNSVYLVALGLDNLEILGLTRWILTLVIGNDLVLLASLLSLDHQQSQAVRRRFWNLNWSLFFLLFIRLSLRGGIHNWLGIGIITIIGFRINLFGLFGIILFGLFGIDPFGLFGIDLFGIRRISVRERRGKPTDRILCQGFPQEKDIKEEANLLNDG